MSQEPRDNPAQHRERQEPEELHTPIGWPLLVVFLGIIAWGASYYFSDLLSATGATSEAGDRRSVVVVDPTAKADGAAVYAGNCAACHQATGTGLAGAFPPLDGSEWVLANKEIPIQILLHGISGPMTVKGNNYAGVMPAFAQLKDAELAAVLTHIRTSWENSAVEITVDDIATGRKAFAERSMPWSEAELKEQVGAP